MTFPYCYYLSPTPHVFFFVFPALLHCLADFLQKGLAIKLISPIL